MNNNLENKAVQEKTPTKSAEPSLCVGCFEFFGNPAHENLCSSCYRKAQLTVKSQKKPVEPSPQTAVKPDTQQGSSSENKDKEKQPEETKENEKPQQTDRSKCWNCSKKVGVMGYDCRCGYTFCKGHRLPEDHSCEFDYTTKGREVLKEKNPLVAASKLEKI